MFPAVNYKQALDYLNSFINYEKDLGQVSPKAFCLDRVRKLLALLGNPQDGLRIIHVAGSKGKGSTCAFTASILKHAGYRVGLFSSPHIRDLCERVRVLDLAKGSKRPGDIFDDMISKEEFTRVVSAIKEKVELVKNDPAAGNITFFEVLTALALVDFKQAGCDFVVLETGLGGRLDATNVPMSMVAAITPIDLEHTHILGDTLEKITHEKKAIIKNRAQRVVLAPQENSVLDLLKAHCGEFGIKPSVVGEDLICGLRESGEDCQNFNVQTAQARYDSLVIPLMGEHQLVNAALALGIIEQVIDLGYPVAPEGIYAGFKETYWPLRFERCAKTKNIILDGAHTPASSKVLVDAVKKIYPDKKVTMIMGFTRDKDIQGMCREFNRIAQKIYITQSRHPRSFLMSDEAVSENFPSKPCIKTQSVREAFKMAKDELTDDDILLISGSLYLASEARELCIS